MADRHPFGGFETVASGFTNNMYLPRRPLEDWSIDECRRALCAKANGDVMKCLDCMTKCKYGRRVEELLAPVEVTEDQADKPKNKPTRKAVEKAANTRSRNAAIKYLRAIESGNPKLYLQARGLEVRNNLSVIRNKYKGVTPEEATRRLAEMGAGVEETQGMPVNATKTPVEQPAQANPDKYPAEREAPASPVGTAETAALQIHALSGAYFCYTRAGENGLSIEPNPVCIATAADVDAICAEIKAAFKAIGGFYG